MKRASLILQPALSDSTREEVEAHIEAVRARRMVATIEYHSLKNAKLIDKSAKIKARLDAQAEMLRKEILASERADQKIQDRLIAIEQLKQEMGVLDDMLVDVEEG